MSDINKVLKEETGGGGPAPDEKTWETGVSPKI